MLDSEYKECDSTVVNDEEEHGEKESKQVNENNRNSNKTHHRKRKKQFFNTIRHQMEFYFGDANLSKDRFINKLLAKDPCKNYIVLSLESHDFEICLFLFFRCAIEYISQV